MSSKRLFNRLELSFAPLCNYDFAFLKSQNSLTNILADASIYIIVQRPALTFENLYVDPRDGEDWKLKFNICKKGSTEKLECCFPYRRGIWKELYPDNMQLHFQFDYEFTDQEHKGPPYNHVSNFLLCGDNNGGSWFSPEKFLYDFWNQHYDSKVSGNILSFLKYKVHYIGKATEENVLKRLTGHEHLQDILSTEFPLHYGNLPSDEIAILFYEFCDNIHMNMYGPDDDMSGAFNQMANGGLPEIPKRTIYLDAEKALIHALKPKHNKLFYKNYPNTKDGLKEEQLDTYTYSFIDPITLIYEQGEISGHSNFFAGDMLLAKKDEPLRIVKGS